MTHAVTESANDARILVVEDDEIMRQSLEDRLHMEGIPVVSVSDLAAARRELSRGGLDLVVADVRLPDGNGQALFEQVCREHPGTPVVLMTAYASVPDAVSLVKAGAMDYLTKPFDIEEFIALVRRNLSRVEDARQAELVARDGTTFRAGSGVLGRSPAMRRIEELVARLRDVDSSVLITGESGVGKEVVAQLIHRSSRRAEGRFVAVNCAAIPINLVESELFGHERGAFTGAERRHVGRFEMAMGGTIFLDEVAEIPPEVQVKLLRILQERMVERVGGGEPIPLNVRVLAASQVNLEQALEQGRFRPDLYWRLNVIHIAVPALRDRPEDVVYLARKFITEYAQEMGKGVAGLSASAEVRLLEMPFPGNVRELKNVIERAVALCVGQRVQIHDLLPFEAQEEPASEHRPSLKETVEEAERAAILCALDQTGWAIGAAAETLGISRKNLWEKMKRNGIARQT